MTIRSHVDSISHQGVAGWALDTRSPDQPLEVAVLVDGREQGRCRAQINRPGLGSALGLGRCDNHGFHHTFSPPLSTDRAWQIAVIPAGGSEPLVNGARTLYSATRVQPTLVPVMVTSTGRAGSTWLMSQFVRHPEIVLGDNYPYELKYGTYYATVQQVLTLHAFSEKTDFVGQDGGDFRIGANPWNRPDLHRVMGGYQLERFFRESVPNRVHDFCRGVMLDAYGMIAVERGKLAARWFAEKTPLDDVVRFGFRGIFGEVREIVLVRDPRDYLCSSKAFWKLTTPEVFNSMRLALPQLEQIDQSARSDVMVVRYEDMILEPARILSKILRFIGSTTPVPPETTKCDLEFRSHATSESPAASIGRWKHDLTAAEVAACEDGFPTYMERFGYRRAD